MLAVPLHVGHREPAALARGVDDPRDKTGPPVAGLRGDRDGEDPASGVGRGGVPPQIEAFGGRRQPGTQHIDVLLGVDEAPRERPHLNDDVGAVLVGLLRPDADDQVAALAPGASRPVDDHRDVLGELEALVVKLQLVRGGLALQVLVLDRAH